jgi:hypothetical protein
LGCASYFAAPQTQAKVLSLQVVMPSGYRPDAVVFAKAPTPTLNAATIYLAAASDENSFADKQYLS